MSCRHLTKSLESYILHDDGQRSPTTHYLCDWADAHPEQLLDAPRWLSVWALSGGPNFAPEKHCPNCPGFESDAE